MVQGAFLGHPIQIVIRQTHHGAQQMAPAPLGLGQFALGIRIVGLQGLAGARDLVGVFAHVIPQSAKNRTPTVGHMLHCSVDKEASVSATSCKRAKTSLRRLRISSSLAFSSVRAISQSLVGEVHAPYSVLQNADGTRIGPTVFLSIRVRFLQCGRDFFRFGATAVQGDRL